MNDSQEIWKDIIGYENLYQVSNYGNVRRLDYIINNNGGRCFHKGQMIKLQTKKDGYLCCSLCKNGKQHTIMVHKVVAKTFMPNKSNFKCMADEDRTQINLDKLEINHIDENKLNNNVNNLEWCTHKYNMNYNNLIYKTNEKLGKPVAKYNINNFLIETYKSASEASRQNNINVNGIIQCCLGHLKTSGGFKWKYLERKNYE